ncbi:hypothetical protein SISSUDRAFT_997846 [Sistotremastrum suecicum HHB10207 ss-3]|uniref:RNA polymerase III RPC4-domain-containing protein n=1 Tax=Sistotremastrum suecicum HHB10207 ss-3 TaxID=1314776 RepID=A0A166HVE0_9AGAM|nr:hypothetical protein SISSUDRAFT_997846 [Sistotremastrum suecicum HHB10207 ss-3]
MSEPPVASTSAAGDSAPAPSGSKAIGSFAKKQDDITRKGTAKMKFVPTLPVRRKKAEGETKAEEPVASTSSDRGGRGRGRGRGGARGGAPREPVQMTASGPFAMGPALPSAGGRGRSDGTQMVPITPGASRALGANLTETTAPALKREKDKRAISVGSNTPDVEDVEVYSDPDEGVEIVDMSDVKKMDWMAPESLKDEKGKKKNKGKKSEAKVKKETGPPGPSTGEPSSIPSDEDEDMKDLANAIDLSESGDEEPSEDLVEHFAARNDALPDSGRSGKLFFFQFPKPFPTFVSAEPESADVEMTDVDAPPAASSSSTNPPPSEKALGKRVSFAPDVKLGAATPTETKPKPNDPKDPKAPKIVEPPPKVEGHIGQLELYRSGAVKLRLRNGTLLDVTSGSQTTFLQQAVHLDPTTKKLCVLGEVTQRFMVSPDIDALLDDVEKNDSLAFDQDDHAKPPAEQK